MQQVKVDIPVNWRSQVWQGLLFLALFIVANLLAPQYTSIGYPLFFISIVPNLVAIVVLAPLAEELFFRVAMPNFLFAARLTTFFVVVITAALFTVFHYAAYGESFAAQSASFMGAFVFGVVAALITIRTRSPVISTVLHAGFNGWLYLKPQIGV